MYSTTYNSSLNISLMFENRSQVFSSVLFERYYSSLFSHNSPHFCGYQCCPGPLRFLKWIFRGTKRNRCATSCCTPLFLCIWSFFLYYSANHYLDLFANNYLQVICFRFQSPKVNQVQIL